MKSPILLAVCVVLSVTGCHHAAGPQATSNAFGVAIVNISEETQVSGVGTMLDRPMVVQVNDADGNGVAGVRVEFSGSEGIRFEHIAGLTDAAGQCGVKFRLGAEAGKYNVRAVTYDKSGKRLETSVTAIALNHQQILGRELSERHCARCHDSGSTAERVSNHDNLRAPPHSFSDGAALKQYTEAGLLAIIAHGGAAAGKSPEMPPYNPTLSMKDIEAIAAYIHAVAE